MFQPTVVFSNNNKTVTIVGVNGDTVTRNAASTLNFCHRKDGGVTVWVDGEHKSQTTRVDGYGRLSTSLPKPKALGKGKGRRLYVA